MGTIDDKVQADARPSWIDLALLTIVTSFLALFELGEKPLAGDEATSYFIASRSWPDFWTSLTTSEANASLFYAALRLPVAFGSDPVILRLIPALCGIATIPLLYLLLTRLFDRWIAVAGTAALTLNAFFVMHAQDIRGYSMSAMFATLATLLFVLSAEKPSALRLTSYVAAAVAGCYSHFFCALVVAAHFLSLFALPKPWVAWRRFMVAFAGIGALCIPLAYFVLANDKGQIDWILPTTGGIIVKNLSEFAGHGDIWLGILVALCVVAAVVRGAVMLGEKGRSYDSWATSLILLWLVVPFLFTLVVTFFKPLFVARYLLPAIPALAAAIGVGLYALRWKLAFVAATLVVLVLSALQLPDWYTSTRPDWELRADRVIENAEPGDVMVFYSPTTIRPFGYYAGYYAEREDGAIAPRPIYPPDDWLGYSQARFEPDLEAIVREAAERERVWLVTAYAEDEERQIERAKLVAALEEACGRVPGFTGAIRLYEGCISQRS